MLRSRVLGSPVCRRRRFSLGHTSEVLYTTHQPARTKKQKQKRGGWWWSFFSRTPLLPQRRTPTARPRPVRKPPPPPCCRRARGAIPAAVRAVQGCCPSGQPFSWPRPQRAAATTRCRNSCPPPAVIHLTLQRGVARQDGLRSHRDVRGQQQKGGMLPSPWSDVDARNRKLWAAEHRRTGKMMLRRMRACIHTTYNVHRGCARVREHAEAPRLIGSAGRLGRIQTSVAVRVR
jgi:hypothetical protein